MSTVLKKVTKQSLGLGNVDNTSDTDKPISTAVGDALNGKADTNHDHEISDVTGLSDALGNKSDVGHTHEINQAFSNSYSVWGGDDEGIGRPIPGWYVNPEFNGLDKSLSATPVGGDGYKSIENKSFSITPTEDAPNVFYDMETVNVAFSNADENEFDANPNGQIVRFRSNSFAANQTPGGVGQAIFTANGFDVGTNDEAAITFGGFGVSDVFGAIRKGVEIVGQIRGYSFGGSIEEGVTFGFGSNIQGFSDNFVIQTELNAWYSPFQSSPTIAAIGNNFGFTIFNMSPQIGEFVGNAGFIGLNLGGNYGTFGTGGWQGINIDPSEVGSVTYARGIRVNMDNVEVNPGSAAFVEIQDVTITFKNPGNPGDLYVQYFDTTTQGNESAALVDDEIQIQIESGVSTAQQVKDAIEANLQLNANVDVTITGTASNPQVSDGTHQFTPGTNPGNKLSAELRGDVQIEGALSFTGAFSIGALNAFADKTPQDTGGQPDSLHLLVSGMTVDEDSVTNNADLIGVNTAALMNIGVNAEVYAGPFGLGLTALGLPAVLSMSSDSYVSHVNAAMFAVNLNPGGAGEVENLHACRAVFIPNGTTSVVNSRGFVYDEPFGWLASNAWGVWINSDAENWFKKSVKIGGAAGSTDKVTNANTALDVEGGMILVPEFDNTGMNALTPVNRAIIYNNEDHKFKGYANGVWVDLH